MALTAVHKMEDGRRTATAKYKGATIEVVAGYDIGEDKFRFHVYVTGKDGTREKVHVGIPYADTLDQAESLGLAIGKDKLGG